MDLAIELVTVDTDSSGPLLEGEISESDDARTTGLKLQSTINNVLSEILNLLDMNQVNQVVDTLRTSNSGYIFGVG